MIDFNFYPICIYFVVYRPLYKAVSIIGTIIQAFSFCCVFIFFSISWNNFLFGLISWNNIEDVNSSSLELRKNIEVERVFYAGTYSCRSVQICWVLIFVGPTASHKVDLLNINTHWEIPAKHKMSRVMRNFELEKWELGNEFEWWDLSVEIRKLS